MFDYIKNRTNNNKKISFDKISVMTTDSNDASKIYCMYQPFGKQNPPDFIILVNNKPIIKIECKSSDKQCKPVWNCSIPEKETIYIFGCKKLSNVFIFMGDSIVDDVNREELKKICG
jgi:hypothetical protein